MKVEFASKKTYEVVTEPKLFEQTPAEPKSFVFMIKIIKTFVKKIKSCPLKKHKRTKQFFAKSTL